MWENTEIPQSYRIPIVMKEVFKLYFGKDATRVWNYTDKDNITEKFTSNGRKVHVYFD